MKTKQGFTLVELVVTLVVTLMILAVGIPVFSTMIANNRAAADSNALVTAFQLARSEAVKRAVQVAVCAGNGTAEITTPTDCGVDDPDWDNGLVVGILAGDGTMDEILRVWGVFKGADDMVSVTPSEDVSEVSFAADGTVGDAVCLHLVRKAAIGAVVRETERWLAIDNTGRTRVVNKSDCDSVSGDLGPCSCPEE